MTVDEANLEFEVFLDKRSTSQVPEVPAEQVDLYLNEAISRFIKTRYGGNNLYRTSAEETQKRRDDLRTLLTTVELTPTLVASEELTYAIGLPGVTDYMFLSRVRLQTQYKSCPAKWVGRVRLVQQDDLEVARVDPFNSSTSDFPIIYDEEGDIYALASEDFTITNAKVSYWKTPPKVKGSSYDGPAVEFTLPAHTHKEIVQIAVGIALETIESPRVQTIPQQLNNIE